MSVETSHYHVLTCNARMDNLVNPVCTTRSQGKWHDLELLEKESEQLGWTKTPKGHLCPAHSAEAAASQTVSPRSSKPKSKPSPEPFDATTPGDWSGQ